MQSALLPDSFPVRPGAPLQRTTTAARISAGTLLIASSLLTPQTITGMMLLVLVVVIYTVLSGMPLQRARSLFAFGLMLYLPFAVLLFGFHYVIKDGLPTLNVWVDGNEAMGILTRGMCTMFIAVTTVSTMRLVDLKDGLHQLRLPQPLVALVTQILQQSSILLTETKRVFQAMRLRGASSGIRTSLLLVRSLPLVWLPRMITKSERVGRAMEARLFDAAEPEFQEKRISKFDMAYLLSCLAVLATSIALRAAERSG